MRNFHTLSVQSYAAGRGRRLLPGAVALRFPGGAGHAPVRCRRATAGRAAAGRCRTWQPRLVALRARSARDGPFRDRRDPFRVSGYFRRQAKSDLLHEVNHEVNLTGPCEHGTGLVPAVLADDPDERGADFIRETLRGTSSRLERDEARSNRPKEKEIPSSQGGGYSARTGAPKVRRLLRTSRDDGFLCVGPQVTTH